MSAVDVFLETDRMVLCKFTGEDLELIVDLDSDPEVKRYIDNGAPIDRDDLVETLDWWLGYYTRFESYGFWAAIEKATGRFLGWFHFRPGEGAGPLEPELGVARVYAGTMAINIGSRRVVEKAALRFVRTFHADWPVRIPGDEEGDVEYAIDRAQWEADRAAQ